MFLATLVFASLVLWPCFQVWYDSDNRHARSLALYVLIYFFINNVLWLILGVGSVWVVLVTILAFQIMFGWLTVPTEVPPLKVYMPQVREGISHVHDQLIKRKRQLGLPPQVVDVLIACAFELIFLTKPEITNKQKLDRYAIALKCLAYRYAQPFLDQVHVDKSPQHQK